MLTNLSSIKCINKYYQILCLHWSWVRNVFWTYRKTSNISRTLVSNKIVDNSDAVGASPIGAAPTISSFSTQHLASIDWAKTTARGYKKHLNFGIFATYTRGFTVIFGGCYIFLLYRNVLFIGRKKSYFTGNVYKSDCDYSDYMWL